MISKVFHFIWLHRKRGIDLLEYMSIYSKIKIYKDTHKYILWTDKPEERNDYLNELISLGLEVKYIFSVVDQIHEGDKNWINYGCDSGLSFECDYYRFQLLNKYGGIYSDLDSITLREIPEYYYNNDWVSVIENIPGTNIPYGMVIGFFMCTPSNPFLYKFLYLRDRITSHYIPTMQLGLLCTDTNNSYFPNSNSFIPYNYTDSSIGKFLRSTMDIVDVKCTYFNAYELHCYGDAINRIENGMEMLNNKLIDYKIYLDERY